MAKIGILLPYENMLDLVDQAIAEPELAEIGRNIVCKKLISTEDAVNEARLAVEAGAEILIARGYQAFLIKKYTNIPLVEMRLHTQEIGSLLKKAKSLIKKEKPHVALLVFRNMVRDMEELSELFDVQLTVHYLEGLDNIGGTLHSIASDEVDMIIGGHAVCREAETIGLLAIRYGASVVSVREALFEADRMSFAIDTEKHNSAQFETLLDTTFNGIIKINESAQITVINRIVEDLAGQDAESVKGLPINEVFPGLENTGIQDILDGKVDTFTTTINIRKQLFVLMIAPIQLNGQIKGAILSLEKILPAAQRDFRLQKDMYLNGYSADMTFDRLVSGDGNMQRQLELAKRYALSDRPVLIYSGEGSEYFWISQAIHNNSRRKPGPFLRINVPAIRPELQEKDIFGTGDTNSSVGGEKKAAVVQANMGTLFLKGIESLCMEAQYRLVRSFQQGSEARSDFQGIGSPNVRFIIQSGKNLKQLVEEGSFCEALCATIVVSEPVPTRYGCGISRIYTARTGGCSIIVQACIQNNSGHNVLRCQRCRTEHVACQVYHFSKRLSLAKAVFFSYAYHVIRTIKKPHK